MKQNNRGRNKITAAETKRPRMKQNNRGRNKKTAAETKLTAAETKLAARNIYVNIGGQYQYLIKKMWYSLYWVYVCLIFKNLKS